MTDRAELRDSLRQMRRGVTAEARTSSAELLARRVLDLEDLPEPGRIGTYVATDGELDPASAGRLLRTRGWSLHLPVVGQDRSIRFAPWTEGAPMAPNRFGIPEPVAPDEETVDVGQLNAIFVPCVGADPQGNRLGFGAGFYDRALGAVPALRRPVLIGIVWDEALVDSIEPTEWDVPVDVVLTERRTLRPGRVRN
jgi:5-formyltetrahydrofolate cyclo-ligase